MILDKFKSFKNDGKKETQTVNKFMKQESDYTIYKERFITLFEAYDKSSRYLKLSQDFKSSVDEKRNWIERLSSTEFPVAFLGTFSAGKSTIINAILGRDILPESTGSSTAVPTLIKKSNKREHAIIFYLDKDSKQELKKLYIKELSKELRKNTDTYLQLSNDELITEFEQNISEAKKQGNFNKEKYFKELKMLISTWDKLSGQKDIQISELSSYITEKYENILFVDSAEVYLTDMNIPESIFLVDLPGLSVANPRHRKITKDYVENKAKAFVVASKVLHLLEGEERELLAEIHKQRPNVLQRAFWVFNQWDLTKSDKQRKQVNADFEKIVKDEGFNISSERVFKVSALIYLLLKLLQEDKLENSYNNAKEHLNILTSFCGKIPKNGNEAGKFIESIEEAKNFTIFKDELFHYLEYTAKAEFLEEAKDEYKELATKLCEAFAPLHNSYKGKDEKGLRSSFIAGELIKRLEKSIKVLNKIVIEQIKILRTDELPALVFWEDEDRNQLEEEIKAIFDNLDKKDLKNELLIGPDLDDVFSRLPQKIEDQLPITEYFRERLQQLMDKKVVTKILKKFLNTLKRSSPLSEELSHLLDDKLSSRNMSIRLQGWCDVFLFDYGKKIDALGKEVLTKLSSNEQSNTSTMSFVKNTVNQVAADSFGIIPNESFPEAKSKQSESVADIKDIDGVINQALDFYKDSLLEFIKQQQSQINQYAKRGIKNYFEELEVELINLFDARKEDIAQVIMEKIDSEIDGKLNTELKKQKVIKESYKVFSNS